MIKNILTAFCEYLVLMTMIKSRNIDVMYIVSAFGMDQEIPDYDMDSEDETWLTKQAKKMEVTPLQFENMMDRLEKGSGQVVSKVVLN